MPTPEDLARWAEPRRYRSHANARSETTDPTRRFDTTALHFDQHGRLVSHADYMAHCEKYDYAWRSIQRGDRVLDVGCGTDAPLMRAVNFVQSQAAKLLPKEGGAYVGVDLNPLKPTGIAWARLVGGCDYTTTGGEASARDALGDVLGTHARSFTLAVCLEAIEHMSYDDGRALLERIFASLEPGGNLILSTPVYDGKGQARNHLHEYYVDELRDLVESVGFEVARRMGTFTAEPQILAALRRDGRDDWLALYREARAFHSAGYMSGLLAPMYPDDARNNVWLLVRP